MFYTALSALLAGLVHVFAGPDHLTAVAPLAASQGRHGWRSGSMWGLGHAAGVTGVAVAAVLLRDLLPPLDVLSRWSERIVGGALIGVGLWALRRSAALRVAPHVHDTGTHAHVHVQRGPAWLRRLGHAHASFYLGALHGIAGSSHFFGVLPALALPSLAASLAYVGGFAIGSVLAMTAFATVLGRLGDHLGGHFAAQRALMSTAGLAALLVGAVWLVT